ncbi:hypothetical protein [Rhodopseudomonas palustris]|uniref:hypothetical protein n=1 Tax=Rhodopseudomonas palustris TaxID=1076 RepID=UPI001304D3EC|nr:hypothetical protein [Rhodopseudomonas palustris]
MAIEENDAGELHDRHLHRRLAKPRSRSVAQSRHRELVYFFDRAVAQRIAAAV